MAVLIDSAIAVPMAQVLREYARSGKTAVSLSIISQEDIASEQIAEGIAADVLITADERSLGTLRQQGLLDIYSETPLMSDELVLVGPETSRLEANFSRGFPAGKLLAQMGEQRLFVVGHPETLPEGALAREAMRSMRATADLEEYTTYARTRQEIYDLIRTQNAYGLLLNTDARTHNIRAFAILPPDTYTPMVYKAVVVAGENMDNARMFLAFLKSEEVRQVFASYGFIPPRIIISPAEKIPPAP